MKPLAKDIPRIVSHARDGVNHAILEKNAGMLPVRNCHRLKEVEWREGDAS